MNICIGGEFELSQSFLSQEFNSDIDEMTHAIYTDTGRSGLYLALQGIIQYGGNKTAWLPRYCCPSVLLPFQQLGFEIQFYTMGEDLQTPADLPTDIELSGATFLFIHYFGKKNYAILDWLSKRPTSKNFYIIEDCVQATLNGDLGNTGDFSVRSYRKFLPQPDGAVLTYKKPFSYQLADADEEFISKKIVGKLLRGANHKEQNFLKLFAESEKRIDHHIIPRHMSWVSKYLLRQTDVQDIKEKRRENWASLQKFLQEQNLQKLLEPIYESLEADEVPVGYPVLIKNQLRDELRQYLTAKKIYCPVHWVLSEPSADFKNVGVEEIMSSSILTLVIDQRVTRDGLKFMVDAIATFAKERA